MRRPHILNLLICLFTKHNPVKVADIQWQRPKDENTLAAAGAPNYLVVGCKRCGFCYAIIEPVRSL